MLHRAIHQTNNFDDFCQYIINLTINRTLDWDTTFTPNNAEDLANALYFSYQKDYERLVKALKPQNPNPTAKGGDTTEKSYR